MHDGAVEPIHPGPVGCVPLGVPVVPLAHPEERGGEAHMLARVGADHVERPSARFAGPRSRHDAVLVTDVRSQLVLVDHLTQVPEDLGAGGDRRTGPGLEAVAKGEEIAVGADPRVPVGPPGTPEGLHGLEDDERPIGTLLAQMMGPADSGDPRAHDQHVDVALLRRVPLRRCLRLGRVDRHPSRSRSGDRAAHSGAAEAMMTPCGLGWPRERFRRHDSRPAGTRPDRAGPGRG